jgi:hypothetical protein
MDEHKLEEAVPTFTLRN